MYTCVRQSGESLLPTMINKFLSLVSASCLIQFTQSRDSNAATQHDSIEVTRSLFQVSQISHATKTNTNLCNSTDDGQKKVSTECAHPSRSQLHSYSENGDDTEMVLPEELKWDYKMSDASEIITISPRVLACDWLILACASLIMLIKEKPGSGI